MNSMKWGLNQMALNFVNRKVFVSGFVAVAAVLAACNPAESGAGSEELQQGTSNFSRDPGKQSLLYTDSRPILYCSGVGSYKHNRNSLEKLYAYEVEIPWNEDSRNIGTLDRDSVAQYAVRWVNLGLETVTGRVPMTSKNLRSHTSYSWTSPTGSLKFLLNGRDLSGQSRVTVPTVRVEHMLPGGTTLIKTSLSCVKVRSNTDCTVKVAKGEIFDLYTHGTNAGSWKHMLVPTYFATFKRTGAYPDTSLRTHVAFYDRSGNEIDKGYISQEAWDNAHCKVGREE
jgi:predicted small secreted protein